MEKIQEQNNYCTTLRGSFLRKHSLLAKKVEKNLLLEVSGKESTDAAILDQGLTE